MFLGVISRQLEPVTAVRGGLLHRTLDDNSLPVLSQ